MAGKKIKSASKKNRGMLPRQDGVVGHLKEWLTVEDAAEYLHVTSGTIYRWTKAGKLPVYKFNGTPIRIKRSDLEALAKPVHSKSDAWSRLSAAAFNEDWDNSEDAIYDNWRALYGLQQG